MPNWCQNTLSISGNKNEINKVLELIRGNETAFDLNKVIPMPEEFKNTASPVPDDQKVLQKQLAKKYGSGNWYDWSLNNWGTKWNTNGAEIIDDSGTSVKIYCDTAWSPPVPVVKALSKKFPKIRFVLSYCEPGMCFAGELECKGDEVADNYYEATKNNAKYKKIAKDFGMDEEEDK
jgi:hypothetical protein